MKKKILVLITIILWIFSFTGCAKCIKTEYEKVEVSVVDSYHRATYVTPISTGKVTSVVTHPAVYHITVTYEDVNYTISGYETYHKYKNKIGQNTFGTLEIRTYDDGTKIYDITELD